jgi:hypothetical protein
MKISLSERELTEILLKYFPKEILPKKTEITKCVVEHYPERSFILTIEDISDEEK